MTILESSHEGVGADNRRLLMPEKVRSFMETLCPHREQTKLPDQEGSPFEYASLISRVTAGFIDCTIGIIIAVTVAIILYRILAAGIDIGLFIILMCASLATVFWLYFAVFESSSWQATPGKRLCNMIVLTSEGRRLTFTNASLRFSLNMFRVAPIVDAALMGLDKKGQNLEDIVSNTVVLRRKSRRG